MVLRVQKEDAAGGKGTSQPSRSINAAFGDI
jgi:hypothetical protein